MTGLWKAWKAKSRLPTLSTSPLGISPKAGEIPTFPQRRRRGRMEKWKTKSRFSTFPPPRILLSQMQRPRRAAGLSPAPALEPAALRAASKKNNKGDFSQHPITGSSRIGTKLLFQAHPALESILDFRLISGLENARHAPGGNFSGVTLRMCRVRL